MITVDEKFSACVMLGDLLVPNSWEVTVEMVPTDKKALDIAQENYSKAIERVKFYFADVLDKSLFLSPESLKYFSTPTGLKTTVQLFPEIPTDHLLTICLFTKLNSIVAPVFAVSRIKLSGSLLDSGVGHVHDIEFGDLDTLRAVVEPETEEYANYWYRPNITVFEVNAEGMQLVTEEWSDYGLEFGG